MPNRSTRTTSVLATPLLCLALPPSVLGEVETKSIRVGDLVFDARIAGPTDGQLVVLLHGFPQTSFVFRRQLEWLGSLDFRAVAPDQRRYSPGARPDRVEDYAMAVLVDDVLGLAHALGYSRFHLVGHDWGEP